MKGAEMRIGRTAAVLAVAMVLVGAACGRSATPPLTVVATDFAFAGFPATVQGDRLEVTFRNDGAVGHELALVEIGDATLDDFTEEFPALLEGGPFPDFFGAGSVPFEIEPGESVTETLTLSAGRYLLFCALQGDPEAGEPAEGEEPEEGPPHYELGMYQEVTVQGDPGELEADDGVIAARDYTFDLPDLRAGTNELVFRNDGPEQWHHVVAFEYPEGTDEEAALEAFRAMLEAEDGPPPAGVPEPEEAGFSGVFSPGLSQTFELELRSGRSYVFTCFIHDQDGGPPHAIAHDMFVGYTVP